MTPNETILVLASAHIAVAISPGPNFVLMLQSAARSRQLGFIAALGIWPAGLILAIAGMFGLGTLLAALPQAEFILRLTCGLYLLWLGFKMVRGSFNAPKAGPTVAAPVNASLWLTGFLTNITNPKSIAYYLSIFTATGAFDLPWNYKIAVLAMMPTISLIWYGSLVVLVSSGPMRRLVDSSADWLNRLAGGIMILFGLKLLAQK